MLILYQVQRTLKLFHGSVKELVTDRHHSTCSVARKVQGHTLRDASATKTDAHTSVAIKQLHNSGIAYDGGNADKLGSHFYAHVLCTNYFLQRNPSGLFPEFPRGSGEKPDGAGGVTATVLDNKCIASSYSYGKST